MTKLKRIVSILEQNKLSYKKYYQEVIFKPYNIKPIDFSDINNSYNDALKLFYFSLTTRQRTSNNPITYEQNLLIKDKVEFTLRTLCDSEISPEERYFSVLRELNRINGAGQKITTMFLKYLINNSKHLPQKRKLLQILWIPLDVHLIKFLFSRFNGEPTKRFKIFRADVFQNKLSISFNRDGTIKQNFLYQLQKKIKDKFQLEHINNNPIIFDNLWIIGSTRCTNKKFSELISCIGCPFNSQYIDNGTRKNMCKKEE